MSLQLKKRFVKVASFRATHSQASNTHEHSPAPEKDTWSQQQS